MDYWEEGEVIWCWVGSPAGKAFWMLLTEGLGEINWPWPVIELQAVHGLVHSSNLVWKHIVPAVWWLVPYCSLNWGNEIRGKGGVWGGESKRGKERNKEKKIKMKLQKEFLICSHQFLLHPDFSIYCKDQVFLREWVIFMILLGWEYTTPSILNDTLFRCHKGGFLFTFPR